MFFDGAGPYETDACVKLPIRQKNALGEPRAYTRVIFVTGKSALSKPTRVRGHRLSFPGGAEPRICGAL